LGTQLSQTCIENKTGGLAATTKPNLATQLRLQRGLAEAFDSNSLSDLGAGWRSDKLDDFVILACAQVMNKRRSPGPVSLEAAKIMA
jgi:hypothetical protein